MRHRLAILIPFLMLAACGGGSRNEGANASADAASYELPGGRFDRERFRAATIAFCRRRAAADPTLPPETRDLLCGCVANQLMDDADDAALRAMVRDERLAVRRNDEALAQCGGPGGDEPPPPPEPPPSMNDTVPPPVVPREPAAAPPEPAIGAPGPARPVMPLGSYLSADDYPAAATRNNEQGTVAFTLDVGRDGRVTACRIRRSSGSASLDSTTCRIMRSRARYHPARNAQGVAVVGTGEARVRWVLPPD